MPLNDMRCPLSAKREPRSWYAEPGRATADSSLDTPQTKRSGRLFAPNVRVNEGPTIVRLLSNPVHGRAVGLQPHHDALMPSLRATARAALVTGNQIAFRDAFLDAFVDAFWAAPQAEDSAINKPKPQTTGA